MAKMILTPFMDGPIAGPYVVHSSRKQRANMYAYWDLALC